MIRLTAIPESRPESIVACRTSSPPDAAEGCARAKQVSLGRSVPTGPHGTSTCVLERAGILQPSRPQRASLRTNRQRRFPQIHSGLPIGAPGIAVKQVDAEKPSFAATSDAAAALYSKFLGRVPFCRLKVPRTRENGTQLRHAHRRLRNQGKITSVFSDFRRACPGRNHNWPATGEGENPLPHFPSHSRSEWEGKSGSRGHAVADQLSLRWDKPSGSGREKFSEHQIPKLFFPRS